MPGLLLDRIRRLREAQGLTQAELAVRAGLSRQSLGAIEAGRVDPSLSVMIAVARALGATLDGLVGEVEPAVFTASLVGAARDGDRVIVARAGDAWVAHAVSGPDAEQPADGRLLEGGAIELFADTPEDAVVVPGCAPVLALAAQRMNARRTRQGARYAWLHRTSSAALAALSRGDALIAGVHGQRPRRERWTRVPVLAWESGLIVPAGNPRGLSSIDDLARKSVLAAVREPGSETRRLLDELLLNAGAPADTLVRSRTATNHHDVARMVALGAAAVGFGPRASAQRFGLDFVPLAAEHFDLVCAPTSIDDPRVAALVDLIRSPSFRQDAAALGYEAPSAR